MQEFFFGLAFCGVGGALCALAIASAIRSRRILQSWSRTTGVVVESDFGSEASPHRNATATIEFQDHTGETRRVGRQGYRKPGKVVPIVFDPAGSYNIRVLCFSEIWFIPLILAVLGTLLLVCGFCVWAGADTGGVASITAYWQLLIY